MPFTPFHFGPGAALHALAPRRVSFIAFCAANVLIDLEPAWFLMRGEARVHRFFHTYLGAILLAIATVLLVGLAQRLARRVALPNYFDWQSLAPKPVMAGAFLGTMTHVLLDSVMHADIRPWAPWSEANPLFLLISIDALHLACLAAGLAGLLLLAVRWLRARNAARRGTA